MQSRMAFFSMLIPLSFAVSSCALFDAFTASNTPSALAQSEPQSVQNTPKKPLPKFVNDRGQSEPKPSVTVTKEEELPDFTEIDFIASFGVNDFISYEHNGESALKFTAWTPSLAETKECDADLKEPNSKVDDTTYATIDGENPSIIIAYSFTQKGTGLKADETFISFRTLDLKTCNLSEQINLPISREGVQANFHPQFITTSSKVGVLSTNIGPIAFDLKSGEIVWSIETDNFTSYPAGGWALSIQTHDEHEIQKIVEIDTGKVIFETSDKEKYLDTTGYSWTDRKILIASEYYAGLRISGFLNPDGSFQSIPSEIITKYHPFHSWTSEDKPYLIYVDDKQHDIMRLNADGTPTPLFTAEQVKSLNLEVAGVAQDHLIVTTSNDVVEVDLDGKETGRKWSRETTEANFSWSIAGSDVNISCWNGIASRNGKLPWADR